MYYALYYTHYIVLSMSTGHNNNKSSFHRITITITSLHHGLLLAWSRLLTALASS